MSHPLYQVDAFTGRPFAGNPAAVCLLGGPEGENWMQAVAAEQNLSETAFLHPCDSDEADWCLRWFTPTVEVDLCGHATLASAHALWSSGRHPRESPLRFATRSGILGAQLAGEWIELDFPQQVPEPADPPERLIEALGAMPQWVGNDGADYLFEVADEATVRELRPDMALLGTVEARGVIVTARGESEEYDFVSRFFGPASGVPEDPVTGSAHCTLAPFWGGRLRKSEMVGFQASVRGGIVRVRLVDDRVVLAGQAVMVSEGSLLV